MSFYSVHIPQKPSLDPVVNNGRACVFRVKSEALKVLKQHKDARLKVFSNTDDAENYAETGYEVCQSKYSDIKASSPVNLEKPAYRAPTKQELTEFRKVIESGDCDKVYTKIWDNPRFLISSGDTPTSLKEGYRYNAMHICALNRKSQIAALILETVSNLAFIELVYGKKNQKVCIEASAIILDYFLNMPEKGRCETPLHLAAKIGAVEVVEVLTSYRQCKMTLNNEGLLPKDIICSRDPNGSPELREKIASLLEERFYVPVIRSANNTVPPTIGQPFSTNNPPNLNSDPMSPEVEIQAVAGPMNKEQAKKFCRRWKTPPRMSGNSLPLPDSPFKSPVRFSSTPTKLTPKSINNSFPLTPNRKYVLNNKQSQNIDETDLNNTNNSSFNNKLIEDNNNGGTYENGLLNSNCLTTPYRKKDLFSMFRENNIASPIILNFNDSITSNTLLADRTCGDPYDSPGFKERHLKLMDAEKGFEIIGRELAKEQNVEWKEYWDFLGIFVDIASEKGLKKFEHFLAQKDKENKPQVAVVNNKNKELLDDLCTALDKLNLRTETQSTVEYDNDRQIYNKSIANNAPQLTMPYTCVEKSLQVFAKRMTKNLLHNIDSIVSINDAFLSELKRLKSLIVSFMDDARFLNVNFTKVHSRFAFLIASYLNDAQGIDTNNKSKIQKCLQQIISSPGDRKEHLQCVCNKMLFYMDGNIGIIQPENLKTEENCMQTWLKESKCDCKWDSVLSRRESRRSRIESRKARSPPPPMNRVDDVKSKEWRSHSTDTLDSSVDDDDDGEDVFWSDLGSDDDGDECFVTPPESPSELSVDSVDTEDYHLFLLGNEPTKRDLDVLNAIFHVDINKETYPYIYSWKAAVLRYSNEEMDHFPSPSAIVKKSLSFSITERLPTPRSLFNSPSRPSSILKNKTMENLILYRENRKDVSFTSPDANENSTCSELAWMNVST
ncbi:ankyrin repeat and LEM domain-containing protein 2 homolog [Episyrphus balteatus]|uniref:ankyrin repeat and LEM domain-containing protein 2 homolog n=1 Tax=Episyrphus balteatus TaxID=286459 RepID=UPI002485C578|nr:ankyrin repeat and LEM domain-containing protein 2 homolog [Episyrphus balteatus]